MLTVNVAPGFNQEQRYIISVLLDEFLGVSFTIAESSSGGPFVSISADGKTLLLQQTLFRGHQECLTAAQSLPAQPLPSLFPDREELDAGLFCDERVPIIYGASGSDGRWIARSP